MSLRTWLKDKDPDVWHVISDYLNWDNSQGVVKWIVKQPQCDKATVAKIFWNAGPSFHACQVASGKPDPAVESWSLVKTILDNWRRGFYQRAELAWPAEGEGASIDYYWRSVAEVPGADRALDIPPDLFGPFPGRTPRVPAELMPEENAELWDMLKRQGTFAGPRPGSDQWHAERAKAAAARNQPGLVARLFGRKPN